MILTCPNCETRYSTSASAIGPDGREVRCAKCHHQWFQDVDDGKAPKAPASAWDDEEDISDHVERPNFGDDHAIPEGVKPIHDGSHIAPYAANDTVNEVGLFAKAAGYGAAVFVLAGLIIIGFSFKQAITAAWPPAAMIYEMAGVPVTFAGEGLIIENLSANILKDDQDRDILVLKGRIINMTEKPVTVPKMQAILRSTNGEDGEGWIIDAPVEKVGARASFAFTSDYPSLPMGVGSINLKFVPAVDS